MAGIDNGTGVAGSSFTHYVYPGTYQIQVRYKIVSFFSNINS